jgi:hypothetical protein
MDKLTPEQEKTLKLFSYYCRSHGADEVTQYLYTYQCTIDYYSESWQKGFGSNIDPYEEINNTIQDIIESNSLLDNLETDCENNGNIKINIDCKERKIKISAEVYVLKDHEMFDRIDFQNYDNISIEKIFEKMNENGFKKGVVEFDGGGDSGEIYSKIVFDDEFDEELNDNSLDFLYGRLESFYGGWEINEGSHGKFIFLENKTIELEFFEHREVSESLGTIFYSEF